MICPCISVQDTHVVHSVLGWAYLERTDGFEEGKVWVLNELARIKGYQKVNQRSPHGEDVVESDRMLRS